MKSIALLISCCALATLGCSSSGHSHGSKAEPTMEEMMAAMTRASMAGAEHRALDAFVGTWNTKLTMWMDPGTPPMESTGTMTNAWILDGHYLEQRFEGTFAGQPFTGRGLWGYDVAAKQYIGSWIDSMSTAMMTSKGPASADGKTFKSVGVNTNPIDGSQSYADEVITIDGPNQHTMTMYEQRGGEKVKTMQIVYTRK